MDAPTNPAEIKAAYKSLYMATENAMDALRAVNAARSVLKDAEAIGTVTEVVQAGKNAETRAALLLSFTSAEREELRRAEEALTAAEREQALAKIVVNEIHTLLRLAELVKVFSPCDAEAA